MDRYQVIKPFNADVAGEEIRLEPGEIIPGARVPELESWGRSVHTLIAARMIAPYIALAAADSSDEEIVSARGAALLEQFTEGQLQAALEERGAQVEASDAPADDRKVFTQEHGPAVAEDGVEMVKLPNPVSVIEIAVPFVVETSSGRMSGDPGDFLVYDAVSGHVWPITAEYLEQHYELVSEDPAAGGTSGSADVKLTLVPEAEAPPAKPETAEESAPTPKPKPAARASRKPAAAKPAGKTASKTAPKPRTRKP